MAAFTGNSVVGQVICGDGHVVSNGQSGPVSGPTSAQSFGALAFRVTLGSGGVLSAQAFGAVTIKAAIKVTTTGVSSAQAFGVPTTVATGGPQTRAVVGILSAQSFGALVIVKGPVTRAVGGVGSAQGFGVPTIKTTVTQPSGGVPSAQAFGVPFVPTPIMPQTKAVGSVPSAQVFGALSFRTTVTRAVTGLGTAQNFGVVRAIFPPQTVSVPGIDGQYPPQQPSITGQVICGDGHVVGGKNLRFGFVTILWQQFVPLGGVPSAQRFGTPTGIGGPVWIHVGSCPSAAAFGEVLAYRNWLYVPPLPDEITLTPAVCASVTLTPVLCAGESLDPVVWAEETLAASVEEDLVLAPSVEE